MSLNRILLWQVFRQFNGGGGGWTKFKLILCLNSFHLRSIQSGWIIEQKRYLLYAWCVLWLLNGNLGIVVTLQCKRKTLVRVFLFFACICCMIMWNLAIRVLVSAWVSVCHILCDGNNLKWWSMRTNELIIDCYTRKCIDSQRTGTHRVLFLPNLSNWTSAIYFLRGHLYCAKTIQYSNFSWVMVSAIHQSIQSTTGST